MLSNSKSFERLKKEQQQIIDFAVLICHAVPNAKKTIHGFEKEIEHFSLADPDYFKKEKENKIKEISKEYKENLAKYLIISSFSFFEAYFKSVLSELIEFQGGLDSFVETVSKKHQSYLRTPLEEHKSNKRKLQEPYKKKNHDKYVKYINILESSGNYKMPSELFSVLGVKYLFDLIASDRFRSVMIPDLLQYGFLMDLSEKVNKSPNLKDKTLFETFDYMRNLRNKISHGDNPNIDFSKAMDFIRFLRYLSVKIDKHLVANFFVLENVKQS